MGPTGANRQFELVTRIVKRFPRRSDQGGHGELFLDDLDALDGGVVGHSGKGDHDLAGRIRGRGELAQHRFVGGSGGRINIEVR